MRGCELDLLIGSEHARFVGWNHVLDVDVGVLPSMLLKLLECLLDQVADIVVLFLVVVDLVSYVQVSVSK